MSGDSQDSTALVLAHNTVLVFHLVEGMFVLIEFLFPFIRCVDPLVPENILRILGNINVILRRISFLNVNSVTCNYMEV